MGENIINHVVDMRTRIEQVILIIREHMEKVQTAQKARYNHQVSMREFHPGDGYVTGTHVKWQGPYEVIEAVGQVNYKIPHPDRCRKKKIH